MLKDRSRWIVKAGFVLCVLSGAVSLDGVTVSASRAPEKGGPKPVELGAAGKAIVDRAAKLDEASAFAFADAVTARAARKLFPALDPKLAKDFPALSREGPDQGLCLIRNAQFDDGEARTVDREYPDAACSFSFFAGCHSDFAADIAYGEGELCLGGADFCALARGKSRADKATLRDCSKAFSAEYGDLKKMSNALEDEALKEDGEAGFRVGSGDNFLLRMAMKDGADVLVAFSILAKSDEFLTVGWRVLKRFASAGYSKQLQEYYYSPEVARMLELSLDENWEVAAQVISGATKQVATNKSRLDAAKAVAGEGKDRGVAVLVGSGRLEGCFTNLRGLGPRGDYAYYSFVRRTADYNSVPSLCAQGHSGRFLLSPQNMYDEKAGQGYVCALEWLQKAEFADAGVDDCPKELAGELDDVGALRTYSSRKPGIPVANAGMTYAARCVVRPGDDGRGTPEFRALLGARADLLVVFTVVAVDERAVTIAWRVLKDFEPPKPEEK